MADLARIALFACSLSAVLASSAALVGGLRLGGTGSALGIYVLGAGQIVLLAQVLSIFQALDWPGFLVGHLVIAGGAVAWTGRRGADRWSALRDVRAGVRGVAALAWERRAPALTILLGALLVIGLLGVFLAVLVPPNNADSLAYHMPRVGYYLQFRSLAPYPTDDWRQTSFPANSSVLILWTVAFLRSDVLANLVQFVAWVATVVAVYGLGRQAGFHPLAALFGAGLFALLPQSILQSTSTTNDLLVASFIAVGAFFLLHARPGVRAGAPAPGKDAMHRTPADLVLAGAAVGLALGTKGTAVLALPGLVITFVVLFARRLDRRVLAGVALAAIAAVLLGSLTYAQNLLLYGSSSGPGAGVVRPHAPIESVAYLLRALLTFAFADLTGPLAAPAARPLADSLVAGWTAFGEWMFTILGLPAGADAASGQPTSALVFTPRVHEFVSGVGPIGGLMLAVAALTLVWPGSLSGERRLLAVLAWSYLLTMALTLRWNPYGPGRYVMTACALAAPLLSVLVEDRRTTHAARAIEDNRRGRRGTCRVLRLSALAVAIWSAVTGLYVARFNEYKPLSELATNDRIGLLLVEAPEHEAFFREVSQELGANTTIGVYGQLRPGLSLKSQWEYPLFGPRFATTVVPLVTAGYQERLRLRRPPPWTNESVLETYRPTYIVLETRPPGDTLPGILPERCFELPLRSGKPQLPWELWRCEDHDPRNVLQNGDFRAWPAGWAGEVSGEGGLTMRQVEPDQGEPFALRLDFQTPRGGEGGIVQELPVDGLRGSRLAVDVRLLADRPGAALLWVDDGMTMTEVANATTEAETLRLEHPVDPRASTLSIGLDASNAGQSAVVLVRSIRAIPR